MVRGTIFSVKRSEWGLELVRGTSSPTNATARPRGGGEANRGFWGGGWKAWVSPTLWVNARHRGVDDADRDRQGGRVRIHCAPLAGGVAVAVRESRTLQCGGVGVRGFDTPGKWSGGPFSVSNGPGHRTAPGC